MILIDRLYKYNKSFTPFHMPGHKRNIMLAPYLKKLAADCDITEIDGFDNLHDAESILKDSMEKAAKLWKSEESFYLVNGSTCGLLAAIHSVVKSKDTVIVARNCHKAVYNALELCQANTVFVMPEIESDTISMGCITPSQIQEALDNNKQAKLVIITSPTYEGFISDIKGICDIAHANNVPVLVDEAHGAHLGFGHGFYDGAIKCGADIVIQSLHKTLPSLTQTAIAHINGDIVDKNLFKQSLSIFETSSPSYLLMSSIDGCVNLLNEKGDILFENWSRCLDRFYKSVNELKNIKVLNFKNDNNIFAFDKSKIIISTVGSDITGSKLMNLLRDYNIECEAFGMEYVIAMSGMGDSEDTLAILSNALLDIDKSCCKGNRSYEVHIPKLPEKTYDAFKAKYNTINIVDIDHSVGMISTEYVWAYPPGIPILIPGEKISQEMVDFFKEYARLGIELHSTNGGMPDEIVVNNF